MLMFSVRLHRTRPGWLLVGAISLLLGMILNRFNVSWFGIHRLTSVNYVPSIAELSISAAIFSFGILAFGLAAKYLPVFDTEDEPARAPQRTLVSSAKAATD
jgi:membrane protein implicated in regulation of membrane protease activity